MTLGTGALGTGTLGAGTSTAGVLGEDQVIQITGAQLALIGNAIDVVDAGPYMVDLASGSLGLVGGQLTVVASTLKGGIGYDPAPQYTRITDYLSNDVDSLAVDYWFPHASITGPAYTQATLTSAAQDLSASTVEGGVMLISYANDFYYRIHITPNPINFGAVFSEQGRTIYVWNAYFEPVTLSSITGANDGGLQLTGQDTPPYTFTGLQEKSYSLALRLDGPADINATYAFDFTIEVPVLKITGTRITVFPFAPNWKQPVVERLEWLTDVLQMRDGGEQRLRLRQNPRQSIEYSMLVHAKSARLLGSLLFGWQGRSWGLPLWPQMQRTTTVLSTGTSTIPCTTNGYEFSVGGFVVLYIDETTYESVAISSVGASSITTATPLTMNWIVGTYVMPMRVMTMRDPIQVNRINGDVGTAVVRFFGEQFVAPSSTVTSEYKSLPVLKYEANRVNDVTESWERITQVLDYSTGVSTVFDKLDYSSVSRSHELLGVNLTAVKNYRNFLYYACGRWKPFWSHTMNKDLRLMEDIPIGQEYMIVEHSLYALMVKQHTMRKHIRIETRKGNVYYREILSSDAVNTPAGTEKLILDATLPEVISAKENAVMISFLQTSRLDTDSIEISWIMPAVANFALRVKGVKA